MDPEVEWYIECNRCGWEGYFLTSKVDKVTDRHVCNEEAAELKRLTEEQ